MRRALPAGVCAVAVLAVTAGTAAWADPSGGGTQQWSSSYKYGTPAYSNDVGLSPDGSTVFVTGITNFGPSGRMATLAYDAASGEQKWASQFPAGTSGEFGFGKELATSPDGSTLFVSGFSDCTSDCDASSFEGYTTIAYDTSSGQQEWVARLAAQGGTPYSIDVSPDGSTVFIGTTDGIEDGAVVAYDASTGSRLWRIDRPKELGYYGGGLVVSPDGQLVYVTDTARRDGTDCGYHTTAYDTASGAVVWSSKHRVTDGASNCGTPTDLGTSADGSTVYVTGYGSLASGDHTGLNRSGTVAYDAVTGTKLWATNDDQIRVTDGDVFVSLEVNPDGSAVYVSGDSCQDYPSCQIATLALDTSDGHRLWNSSYDGGGRGYANDLAISPDGTSLFITGQETMPCFTGCTTSQVNAPLVAYDSADGNIRWATTYPDNLGSALAVSPDGESVYLAGTFTSSSSSHKTAATRSDGACRDRCGYSVTRFNIKPGRGTFQDSDPALHYNGWSGFYGADAVGGSFRASRTRGDVATFLTPKVSTFSWLSQQGPRMGKAKVFIDGRLTRVVDLYSPSPAARTLTFGGLTREIHTVKVKVLGRKTPSSQAAWVAVDAFRFHAAGGITEESSAKVRYDSWTGRSTRSASGASLRTSGARTARVSLDFTGRNLRWITMTGRSFGRAKVVIDGKAHLVDLYRPTRTSREAITYTGLSRGSHHVVVIPLGRKDARSSSTNVAVDAFVVRR